MFQRLEPNPCPEVRPEEKGRCEARCAGSVFYILLLIAFCVCPNVTIQVLFKATKDPTKIFLLARWVMALLLVD